MVKRGPKPKGKVRIKWSANFAYAIGLIATDGSLSKDGRHIDLTSKDREQLIHFNKALEASFKITEKYSGTDKLSYRIQVGDVLFYDFLISIGMSSAKSKTLGALTIPKKYFIDFFRGVFDGDGAFYSYYDLRWRKSHMYYFSIASASPNFLLWLRESLYCHFGVRGHVTEARGKSTSQLKYAKGESSKIIKKMYYSPVVICLLRKRKKIEAAQRQQHVTDAQVGKLVDPLP